LKQTNTKIINTRKKNKTHKNIFKFAINNIINIIEAEINSWYLFNISEQAKTLFDHL
jgi:hypothetical protein